MGKYKLAWNGRFRQSDRRERPWHGIYSLYFPLFSGVAGRDWLAADCLHRQTELHSYRRLPFETAGR